MQNVFSKDIDKKIWDLCSTFILLHFVDGIDVGFLTLNLPPSISTVIFCDEKFIFVEFIKTDTLSSQKIEFLEGINQPSVLSWSKGRSLCYISDRSLAMVDYKPEHEGEMHSYNRYRLQKKYIISCIYGHMFLLQVSQLFNLISENVLTMMAKFLWHYFITVPINLMNYPSTTQWWIILKYRQHTQCSATVYLLIWKIHSIVFVVYVPSNWLFLLPIILHWHF